jgi:hypothetical protein
VVGLGASLRFSRQQTPARASQIRAMMVEHIQGQDLRYGFVQTSTKNMLKLMGEDVSSYSEEAIRRVRQQLRLPEEMERKVKIRGRKVFSSYYSVADDIHAYEKQAAHELRNALVASITTGFTEPSATSGGKEFSREVLKKAALAAISGERRVEDVVFDEQKFFSVLHEASHG